MKRLTGQSALLAISVIAIFTISGCFFSNADRDMTDSDIDAAAKGSTSVALVK